MTDELVTWVNITQKGDERGLLNIIEAHKDIPFAIERIYYIHGTKNGVARGFHAHKKLDQLLVCVSGSCEILLDNGEKKTSVTLDSKKKGLLIGSWVWREMGNFSDNCVLLCLASAHYDESDYIRDYDKFIELLKQRDDKA